MREGYRLNNPLRITDGARFDSFAAVDDAGVIIETVKRAERVDGVVLRLYESLGRPTTTALRVDRAQELVRLDESDIEQGVDALAVGAGFAAVARLADGLAPILDLDAFLAPAAPGPAAREGERP